MTLFEMQASHLFRIEVPFKENLITSLRKRLGDSEYNKLFADEPFNDIEENGIFEIITDDTYLYRDEDEKVYDITEHKLKHVITAPDSRLVFVYDFGDNWIVDVTLERVFNDADLPGRLLPRVLEGEGYGIIEDCGGIGGLVNLAKAFKKKMGKEYDAYREWLGLDDLDLKRFDIKVSGSNADFVEKFFTTTESAVLFPEFVKRTIKQGIDESILSNIVAVSTKTDGNSVQGISIIESTPYDTATTQGDELPATTISEGSTSSTLNKIGRIISASYEVVRLQRLDVFAVALKAIGMKLGNAMTKDAITALTSGAPNTETDGDVIAYSDLANLYSKFADFDMTTLIASPTVVSQILKMDEMKECTSKNWKEIILPFGASLLKSSQINDTTVIGLDKNYALELAANTDLIIETDKLIDRQLDRISVSVKIGFKKIIPDAVKCLLI